MDNFPEGEAHKQRYSFFYATNPDNGFHCSNADGQSWALVTGGFVGTYIGLWRSNGEQSSNHADFDWFEYSELAQQES